MGFKCTVKMDAPKTILAKRNLNPGGEAVKTLQKEIHAKAEPYTPKDTGNLIQTVLFNPFIGVLIYWHQTEDLSMLTVSGILRIILIFSRTGLESVEITGLSVCG